MKLATQAVESAESARPFVTENKEEYDRFVNDMHCIRTEMEYYDAKTLAAADVLLYGHSKNLHDLEEALPLLEQSVACYRKLVDLTNNTYRQGPSVHSVSRRIPFLGGPNRYTHWRDCLGAYEKELADFKKNLQMLKISGAAVAEHRVFKPLPEAPAKLTSANAQLFTVEPGAKLYTDSDVVIEDVAPELKGLTGIRVSRSEAQKEGVKLHFDLSEPAQILVGFFRGSKKGIAAAPPVDEWNPSASQCRDRRRLSGLHCLGARPASRQQRSGFRQGRFRRLRFHQEGCAAGAPDGVFHQRRSERPARSRLAF